MAKSKTKTKPAPIPTPMPTLAEAIKELGDKHYGRCDHDEEFYSEAISDVLRLLESRGVIDPKRKKGDGLCSFCDSSEVQIVHKQWCIR